MPYSGDSWIRQRAVRPDERTLTGDITLGALTPSVLCYGATAARTVTLPVIGSVLGRVFYVFNKSTATITFNTSTGGTVKAVGAGKAVILIAIGATWRVIRGSTAA